MLRVPAAPGSRDAALSTPLPAATNPILTLVVYFAIITWLLVVVASLIRARAWTPSGLLLAFGNRDHLADPGAFAGRAERTARNSFDNLVFFAILGLAATASNRTGSQVVLGAQVFFWARMVYIPVYYIGIPYVRTASWAVSIAGLAMMAAALL